MTKLLIAKEAAEKALAAEWNRAESRLRDAWKFVAGSVVVLGFQVRDLKGLVESPSMTVRILTCLSLAVLVLALGLALYSLQSNGPGDYPRGQKLWDNLKPETVSETAAEEALVLMLLQAREQLARWNDAKTRLLSWCGRLFLAGVVFAAGSQLLDAFENWT